MTVWVFWVLWGLLICGSFISASTCCWGYETGLISILTSCTIVRAKLMITKYRRTTRTDYSPLFININIKQCHYQSFRLSNFIRLRGIDLISWSKPNLFMMYYFQSRFGWFLNFYKWDSMNLRYYSCGRSPPSLIYFSALTRWLQIVLYYFELFQAYSAVETPLDADSTKYRMGIKSL